MNRNFKIVFFCIYIFYNLNIFAETKILTTISPLAAIIKILVEDEAQVNVIAKNKSGCAHEYHLRPSDLKLIEEADLIFNINDEFDGFITNKLNKKIISVSDFNGIKIIQNNNKKNWHLWLDLNNVNVILDNIAQVLIKTNPELEGVILNNLEKSKIKISNLASIKAKKVHNIDKLILLNQELEYFFNNINNLVVKQLYSNDYKSMKFVKELNSLIKQGDIRCVVTHNGKGNIINNKQINILELEFDNWPKYHSNTFYEQYLWLTDMISNCLISSNFIN